MSLLNNGIIELNAAPLGPRAVTIVTGLGRSGTSMAACVLDASGIPMGERKDAIVFEDNDLGDAIREDDQEAFDDIWDARTATHVRWGFKATSLHDCGWWLDTYDAVRMVVMVRDPIAVAERAALSDQQHAPDLIGPFADSADRSVMWALRRQCPVLLCSYEKAIMKPRAFVERLVTFAGGRTDNLDGLAALVQPERADYVEHARVKS